MKVERTWHDEPSLGATALRHTVVIGGVQFCACASAPSSAASYSHDELEYFARYHLLRAIGEHLYKDSP